MRYSILSATCAVRWLRRRLVAGEPIDFLSFRQARDEGMTDYLALIHRFAAEGVIGEMDCVYSSWATDAADGFADADVLALQRLAPFLNLAVKSAALAHMAGTLAETYLGRDAGRRVMSGRIIRGVAEKIGAVLWQSDLRSYTQISESVAPEEIIPFLNAYADIVVSAIHGHGGDVLKLIGDGTLESLPTRTAKRPAVPRSPPQHGCARTPPCSPEPARRPGCP